jgi:hypothetical protein
VVSNVRRSILVSLMRLYDMSVLRLAF